MTTCGKTKTRRIDWSTTPEEHEIITKIVARANAIAESMGVTLDSLSLTMDISATHLNGCPLKLQEWLDADDLNFTHDIGGIMRHIDRRTGKLMGCFLPRFAKLDEPVEVSA